MRTLQKKGKLKFCHTEQSAAVAYEAWSVRVSGGAQLWTDINCKLQFCQIILVRSNLFYWLLFYYEKPRCVEFTPYITPLFRPGVYVFVH